MQKRCQQRMPNDSSKMPTTATKDGCPPKRETINKHKMGLAGSGGRGWSRPPPRRHRQSCHPRPRSGGRLSPPPRRAGPGAARCGSPGRAGAARAPPSAAAASRTAPPPSEIRSEVLRLFSRGSWLPARGAFSPSLLFLPSSFFLFPLFFLIIIFNRLSSARGRRAPARIQPLPRALRSRTMRGRGERRGLQPARLMQRPPQPPRRTCRSAPPAPCAS